MSQVGELIMPKFDISTRKIGFNEYWKTNYSQIRSGIVP